MILEALKRVVIFVLECGRLSSVDPIVASLYIAVQRSTTLHNAKMDIHCKTPRDECV